MKKNKWYNASVKPDKYNNLIVMTDMGYIFQAEYIDNEWYTYVENTTIHKVYLEKFENQECIIKWMKV